MPERVKSCLAYRIQAAKISIIKAVDRKIAAMEAEILQGSELFLFVSVFKRLRNQV